MVPQIVFAPNAAMGCSANVMNPYLNEWVSLSEPSEQWASIFETERARLQVALGMQAEHIEHIGSTAVCGLLAMPIVDIQVGAARFPPPPSMSVVLVRLGYEPLGEAGVSGRLYFRRRSAPEVNIHVVLLQGEHWSNNLALRNFLRGSPSAKQQYANAKLAAVRSGATRLQAYSAAKAPVIASLLAQAQASQNAG